MNEDERGAAFQAYKAAFFFKLERELEKVGEFLFLARDYVVEFNWNWVDQHILPPERSRT